MSMSAVLKTHEMVRDFAAAGFSPKQAEVLADWQAKIAEETTVTKADFRELRQDIKVEMATTRAEMATMKVDLIKWFIGVMIAFSGILLAGIKYL